MIKRVFVETKDVLAFRLAHKDRILRETYFSGHFDDTKSDLLSTQVAIDSFDKKKYEFWLAPEKVEYIKNGDIEIRLSKEFQFIRILAHDNDEGLEIPVYSTYKTIFDHINEGDHKNLVRIWNYIPKILDEDGGLERYRQFDIGRSRAWEDFGLKSEDNKLILPSATGIGSHDGPVIIECLLSNNSVCYIENPRQIPAPSYSKKYGPKAPVFSRGTLFATRNYSEVYISGTASLLGEDVVWKDNPQKQVEETFRNISTLISCENISKYVKHEGFNIDDLTGIRVYIKNKLDYLVIKEAVEKIIGNKSILYLYDDICRPDFLVEIEAVAVRS